MRPAPGFLRHAVLSALLLLPATAMAVPRHYALEAAQSVVGFSVDFGPDQITGTMPVKTADLTLDFEKLANCRVSVTLDAAGAQASFPFAAQAMKGPLVLDTAAHPAIRFDSTRIVPRGAGATITGNLTVRGVTRPVVLQAELYRQRGTNPGDLDHLQIRLSGTIDRAAYGADGWADMVGNAVRVNIIATINRTTG